MTTSNNPAPTAIPTMIGNFWDKLNELSFSGAGALLEPVEGDEWEDDFGGTRARGGGGGGGEWLDDPDGGGGEGEDDDFGGGDLMVRDDWSRLPCILGGYNCGRATLDS
ncbi:hypothetical protein CRG98_045417 [Punica granatum]|uniref:Uncharacterized protein n=1 Tax=Punica granatum TaxID=22663 RepID=A0A2I0HR50_PUNGR|nr:hypothetical protein CRG98_045417 [Punica granatum]